MVMRLKIVCYKIGGKPSEHESSNFDGHFGIDHFCEIKTCIVPYIAVVALLGLSVAI